MTVPVCRSTTFALDLPKQRHGYLAPSSDVIDELRNAGLVMTQNIGDGSFEAALRPREAVDLAGREDLAMTGRKRVANRRHHEVIAIEHAGQRYKIGIGRELVCVERGHLGPVAEVFVSAQQVNSTMDVVVSDGAILMSMLIQYGCPPEAIVKSMKHNSDGTPASPLGRAAALISEAGHD
jgi:hypothetical protein